MFLRKQFLTIYILTIYIWQLSLYSYYIIYMYVVWQSCMTSHHICCTHQSNLQLREDGRDVWPNMYEHCVIYINILHVVGSEICVYFIYIYSTKWQCSTESLLFIKSLKISVTVNIFDINSLNFPFLQTVCYLQLHQGYYWSHISCKTLQLSSFQQTPESQLHWRSYRCTF